jgi:hypothetical protein
MHFCARRPGIAPLPFNFPLFLPMIKTLGRVCPADS